MGIAKVLIVDDEKANQKLYQFTLEENNYDVVIANNGEEAIEQSLATSPDVILMDVMMPVMDGISACKAIKNNNKTKHIPIIIISAKNSTDDIINGFKAGADEYLTKPFSLEEFSLRVNSMVRLKKTHDELRRFNSNLEIEVKRKTDQLVEASRYEMIGKMVGGLGHDLNNLFTGIAAYNSMMLNSDNLALSKKYVEKQGRSIELCHNFVKNLLNFSRVQKTCLSVFDPRKGLETTLGILSRRLKNHSIEYSISEEENTLVYGDEGYFNQICLNIISNAIDEMQRGGKLTINIKYNGSYTVVAFSDTGAGIKEEEKSKIFEYLYTTKTNGQSSGSGIGLHITKKIIEAQEGHIEVVSEGCRGCTFLVYLPKGSTATLKLNQASA